jgi:arsenate reductase-like glutaredoxin family protein
MTLSEYNKSIETGELQLSFWRKVSHFRIAIFLLYAAMLLPVIHLFEYVKGNSAIFALGEIYIIIITLLLALLLFGFQKSKLKFKTIKTTLKKEEIIDLLMQLSKEWEWHPCFHKESIFTAKTNSTFSKSIGEQVTVLINNDNILINTINDPDRRLAFGAWERNMKNKEAIITMLERADLIYHN